ncbi:unnamed protein product [Hydatigera taeniaeformis]|uniref:SH3 domain-containing protein n=1 Tax=Hydatigena taeniaeformis TaxID=6205 RepID=A0A0R3WLK9_HYDTA|nr:unnamed protein product [Hydatigera taeniaeformis]
MPFEHGNEVSRAVEAPQLQQQQQQQNYNQPSTGCGERYIYSCGRDVLKFKFSCKTIPLKHYKHIYLTDGQVKRSSLNPESYSFPQPPMNTTNGNTQGSYANANTRVGSAPKNDYMERNGEKSSINPFLNVFPFDLLHRVEEESDAVPIYRPDLVMMGGMKVTGSGMHFQAVYSYEAAEDDEVSFVEGDEILHGEPIDEGWMFGTVRRTGRFGMLPSNYVVPIQNPNYNP